MWAPGWREDLPLLFARKWDLVIVGGGITGAGILLEAARNGLSALLVEQRDFAWGTSSRSSKLVHGGLRYLKEGRLRLTRDSVRERQHLMHTAAGLVEPQSFAFANYRGRPPGRRLFGLGLALYDVMAGARTSRYLGQDDFLMAAPYVRRENLKGGMTYLDAKTDDARLVLRVLQEAQAAGGFAVNHVAARTILREGGQEDGKVSGLELADAATGRVYAVRADVVINATGAWAERLHPSQATGPRLRPLRGSHLLLPAWRLPVAQAVSLMHPQDGRPVFAFPWEGVTLVGTTDVDHHSGLQDEAAITPEELDYLLAALAFQFPQLGLTRADVIATYAGVRPVLDSGKADPSREGREHGIWQENGLITVTGGKLTTFRLIALDTLRCAAPLLPARSLRLERQPVFATAPPIDARTVTRQQAQRLLGRYGGHARELVALAPQDELDTIPGTETLWAELRWAARSEAVLHLDDLLLRRTRLGLQLRGGGVALLARLRSICQSELGWNDARWEQEQEDYLNLWAKNYRVPQQNKLYSEASRPCAEAKP
jgi:glycerol-3-phosphate dehydrogenase